MPWKHDKLEQLLALVPNLKEEQVQDLRDAVKPGERCDAIALTGRQA